MTPLIQLEQVSHAYGHVPLLDEANVQVASGERVAVVGPNGAGKSTLLRILHGALVPDGGRVHRGATVRTGLLVQDVAPREATPLVAFSCLCPSRWRTVRMPP